MLPHIQSLIAQYEISQLNGLLPTESSDLRTQLKEIFYSCKSKASLALTIHERAHQLCLMHVISGSSAFSMTEEEYDIFCTMTEELFKEISISQQKHISTEIAYLLYAYNHNVFDIDLNTPTCSLLFTTIHQWISSSCDNVSLLESLRRLEIIFLCYPEFIDTQTLSAADLLYTEYKLKAEKSKDIQLLWQLYNTEYSRAMMHPSALLTSIATLFKGINEPEADSIKARQQLLNKAIALTLTA